jgi:hypothetical protein
MEVQLFNPKWRRLFVFFSILAFFCNACNPTDKGATHGKVGIMGDTVTIRFSPVPNTLYQYNTESNTDISQEVNGQLSENSSRLAISTAYTIDRDSTGMYRFKITYKGFKLSANSNGEKIELDAETADKAEEASERMFGAFKNAQIMAVVDTVGKVQSVVGQQAITDKMQVLAVGSPAALQMLQTSIKQYVTDEFYKSAIEQQVKLFNGRPLKIGDKWSVDEPINMGISFTSSNSYHFVSLKDGVAKFTLNAFIDIKEQPLNVDGNRVIANLEGKQAGELYVEVATGMVKGAKNKLTITGNLLVVANSVPIKISSITNIKRV